MLLPFSVRLAKLPPVWEKTILSVNFACLS